MASFGAALSSLTVLTFIISAGESFHVLWFTQAKTHLGIQQTRSDRTTAVCSARQLLCRPCFVSAKSLVGTRFSARERGVLIVAFLASRGPSYGDNAGDRVTGVETDAQDIESDTQEELSEEECLHREVFAKEKGFLESVVFNPIKAKQQARETEVARMSTEWGSTPERVQEIMDKTAGDEELSFQELDRISAEMKMTDAQQRAFMLNASMKRLTQSTKLPRRNKRNPAETIVSEKVFADEKGFQGNSKEFKETLKAGSGVRFDADGLPAIEGDPVIDAARKKAKERQRRGRVSAEKVGFPILPDCPKCSAPTTVDELACFGMCLQCRGNTVAANAYNGPSQASKYTYDNGDAPFSSSWNGNSKLSGSPAIPPPSSAQKQSGRGRIIPSQSAQPNSSPGQPETPTTATGELDAAIAAASAHGGNNLTTTGVTRTCPTSNPTPRPRSDPMWSSSPSNVSLGNNGNGLATALAGKEPSNAPSGLGAATAETSPQRPFGTVAVGRESAKYTVAGAGTDEDNKAVLVDITGVPVVARNRKFEKDAAALPVAAAGRGNRAREITREREGSGDRDEGNTVQTVRALTKEVSELRAQLSDVRRQEAITRSALRRLQEDVATLRERFSGSRQ